MQIFLKKNYYLRDVFMWSLKLGEISSLDGWIFTEELYRVKASLMEATKAPTAVVCRAS